MLMIVLVEIIMLAIIGTCRDNFITGVRWPRKQLTFKKIARAARTFKIGKFLFISDLEDWRQPYLTSFITIYCHQIVLIQ